MEKNYALTAHAKSSVQTLVQKLDFEYNNLKLDECPVAWGIVWVEADVSLHHRQSRPNPLNNGGQRHDAYSSIVQLQPVLRQVFSQNRSTPLSWFGQSVVAVLTR